MPLGNGEVFAGYRIMRFLGSGGMGEVYLAQHPRLPRLYALKVLPRDLSQDNDYRGRFTREADLAATLDHPHIVGVHDRGDYDGQLWILMDFVEGSDAGQLLRARYPAGMPNRDAFKIIKAIASALDYAHQHGYIHRDVKPANILLSQPDADASRIMLADFGIARRVHEVSGLTATNVAVGTIYYAAPEQLMGETLDGRADQYALAVTAYELLTGSLPFEHSNPAVVISHRLSATPPTLASKRPELADLDPVLTKALAKDPSARFKTCTDFARALALGPLAGAYFEPGAGNPLGQTAPPTLPGRTNHPTPPYTRVQSASSPSRAVDVSGQRARSPIVAVALVVLLFLAAVVFVVRPWEGDRATSGHMNPPTSAVPPMTFEAMRNFVSGYYGDLPARPYDAWAKVSPDGQDETGQREFVDFWAKIQSVTVVSISPRDATSVVARLNYVRKDGHSASEDRWLRMELVDGVMRLAESGRIGPVDNSSTPPPSPTFSASDIDSVLLTPSEISAITGNEFEGYPRGPVEVIDSSLGTSDNTHAIDPRDCAGVIFGAEQQVYADTGYEAIRNQTLGKTTSDIDDLVEQTAVVFSTAEQAEAILASSTARWRECASGHPTQYPAEYSIHQDAGYEKGWGWYLTNVRVDEDMITAWMSAVDNLNGNAPACQLALGVRVNVVVNAKACRDTGTNPSRPDPSLGGDYAEQFAKAMLGKVKT